MNIQLPEMFRHIESTCRKQISARISRGRIDAYLKVSALEDNLALRQLDMNVVTSLLQLSQRLCETNPQLSGMSVFDVLKWPGVIAPPDTGEISLPEMIVAEFSSALDDLVADRRREGDAIREILTEKVRHLDEISKNVSQLTNQVQKAVEENLREKIHGLQVDADPARFEQELALILAKADVSEEIERFVLHVEEFQRVLTQDEHGGKRLGFIAQEIGREVNTLSSKTGYYPMNTLMVDAKVVIEQIREQLHNIA